MTTERRPSVDDPARGSRTRPQSPAGSHGPFGWRKLPRPIVRIVAGAVAAAAFLSIASVIDPGQSLAHREFDPRLLMDDTPPRPGYAAQAANPANTPATGDLDGIRDGSRPAPIVPAEPVPHSLGQLQGPAGTIIPVLGPAEPTYTIYASDGTPVITGAYAEEIYPDLLEGVDLKTLQGETGSTGPIGIVDVPLDGF
jgi:hypothetical protein